MARQLPSSTPQVAPIAPLLTVTEVRTLFHASAMWVYERIADRDFDTIKAEGKRFVVGASITAYIERKRGEREEPDPSALRARQGRQAKRADRAARPTLIKS